MLKVLIGLLLAINICASEYRPIDGYGVNKENPSWGSVNSVMLRLNNLAATYSTLQNDPTGVNRPSARFISNTLGPRNTHVNTRKISDFHTIWAQLIAVDTAGRTNNGSEPYFIEVPECDYAKDPDCDGNQTISFFRTTSSFVNNTREQINTVTSWLDGSSIYGNSETQTNSIRTFSGGNISTTWSQLQVPKLANPQIQVLGYILASEHNRLAYQFSLKNSSWNDETLFQEARRWNIAFIQKISTREYLAALLGQPLPPYSGYNSTVNPTLDNFYSTVSLRYAHSEIATVIRRTTDTFVTAPEGDVLLRDCWGLAKCLDAGIEAIIRGMAVSSQMEMDTALVADLRDFFFDRSSKFKFDGHDLMAADIQRGRDHGIPDYNRVREAFALGKVSEWSEVTSNVQLRLVLQGLYEDIEDVDAYIGALAEEISNWTPDHVANSNVGPTLWYSLYQQFSNFRDGDPFWYENGQFTSDEISEIYGTTLKSIIMRNTNVTTIPENVFFIQERQLNASNPIGFYSNDPKYTDYIDLSTSYRLSWFIENDEIQFMIQAAVTGWVGIGFDADPNTMKNADIYIGRYTDKVELFDSYALDVGVPTGDTLIGGKSDILYVAGSEQNGVTTIEFRRKLDTGDKWDKPITNKEIKVIFAYNPDTDEFLYHGPTRSASFNINFLRSKPRFEQFETGIVAAIIVLAGLGCALVAVLVFLVIKYKDKFFFYTPIFCVLIAIGGLFGYVSMILLVTPQHSDGACVSRVWLLGYAYIFIFGCLFTKTWRIWRISVESEKLRRVKIKDGYLLRIVVCMLLVESFLLALWTGLAPPTATFEEDPLSINVLRTVCYSSSPIYYAILLVFNGIMLIPGVFLAYLTRNVPPEVNESKTVGVSIYTMTLILIITIPLLIFLNSFPTAVLLIQALATWLIITSTLLLLFVPKLLPEDEKKDIDLEIKSSGEKSDTVSSYTEASKL